MAPEQWPQGGRGRRGKVINCMGVMEAEIGLSPSSHESLLAVWMDWQCKQEMDGAPTNNLYTSWGAPQKDGQKWGTGVCTTSVQVDSLAHLGSIWVYWKYAVADEKYMFWNQSLKQHALNFDQPCWLFFMFYVIDHKVFNLFTSISLLHENELAGL